LDFFFFEEPESDADFVNAFSARPDEFDGFFDLLGVLEPLSLAS
jgi:hypothetical protein